MNTDILNTNHTNTERYCIRTLSGEEILSIYTQLAPLHFPAGELRPLSNIEYLLSEKGYEGLGIFEASQENGDGSLLGYALFVHVPGADTVLLDFYAILEEYRSLGLGSFFLDGMKKHYQNLSGILLETEDLAFARNEAEVTERTRRNAFYYKNGAHPTGVFCTLFGVPFQILFLPIKEASLSGQDAPSAAASPEALAPSETAAMKEKLDSAYHFMLTKERYQQGVRWR